MLPQVNLRPNRSISFSIATSSASSDIDCDLDNDGKNDLQIGGDRSWLYLTADTSSIGKWITDFGSHPSFTLDAHKWLTGKSGTDTDIPIKIVDQGLARASCFGAGL